MINQKIENAALIANPEPELQVRIEIAKGALLRYDKYMAGGGHTAVAEA